MPPTTSPSATPREVPVRPTRIPWARKIRRIDRKSTRLNSSHDQISYAVFCLKKKNRPILVGALHETAGLELDVRGPPDLGVHHRDLRGEAVLPLACTDSGDGF